MTRAFAVTFWSIALLAASLPAANVKQPDTALPPPPGTSRSPSDAAAPTKAPYSTPMQSPAPIQGPSKIQAPAPMIQAPSKMPQQAPHVVTCTVMVPQMSYKTVTVPDVVCRPEVRQKHVNVCRMVPETHMVRCVETICVPEQRTATQQYTVCRMAFETVSKQITVMVPQTETRQGVRTVCKSVPVQESYTVCKDMGHCETQCYVDCCGCTHTCEVWVPNIVTEQVPVTVYKPHYTQEQFSYNVVVCRPEQRTITQQVAKPVYETRTREVSFTVPVAKQIERQIPKTVMRPVMETKAVNYTVMVPHRVERQVTVPVCTMVPKQVTYTVHPCPPCDACGW
jgi:YTV